MRITNSMMLNRYNKSLLNNLSSMDKIGLQVGSFRKFQRASEDPMSSLKALQVRRNISQMEQHIKNIDMADSWLAQTETGVMALKASVDQAVELLIQGRNDTMTGGESKISEDGTVTVTGGDRNIIAEAIRRLQDQLLKDLNTQIAGKYIFGGANTKVRPFEVDEDTGNLIFNGEDVVEAESLEDFTIDPVYYDLGMGFRLDEDDDLVDPNSAFDMYTPGINIIGVGEDNLYNLLGRVAQAFEDDNMELIDGILNADDIDIDNFTGQEGAGLFKKLQDSQMHVLIELVNVGERSKFVTYLQERTDSNLFQAELLQNKLEAVKPDEAIMNYKMQEMVYRACLQMGTYILQPSLMDYLK